MDTLEHLQQEFKDWQQWIKHEQEFYDKCTDEYTKQLLTVRLNSGKEILNKIQKELAAIENVHKEDIQKEIVL